MPRLSIGVPVYNGERYLREAVESLLAQTFTDFEIVICDNASTDGTRQIAEELAAHDSRVRYHRNAENIGASRNFNRVFELCDKSEFFRWAAHDDTCSPTCLKRCIDILDRDPGVVLAYTKTNITDEAGKVIEPYTVTLATNSPRPEWRYRVLLGGHRCFEIFGVVRRDILARTPLIGGYSRGDGILLAYLAMYGRFEEVPEYLFHARQHGDQSMEMIDNWIDYAQWFEPRLKNKRVFPYWRWTFEFLRALFAGRVSPFVRLKGLRYWLKYTWVVRRYLAGEVAYHARQIVRRPPQEPNGDAPASTAPD